MGNPKRKLKDWKIRNIASVLGVFLLLLVLVIFLVQNFTGINSESMLRGNTLGNLENLTLPISPKYLEENQDQIDRYIKETETILFAFSNGGELQTSGSAITISAEPKVQEAVKKLNLKWNPYKNLLYSIIDGQQSIAQANDELKEKYAAFLAESKKMAAFSVQLNEEEESEAQAYELVLYLYIVGLVIAIYWVVRFLIMNPIHRISLTTRELARGNLSKSIAYASRNELGYISENINSLADILKNATEFTTKIGEGDLHTEYKGIDDNHDNSLATSLLQMREKMQDSAIADKERSWVNEGLAKFADILRNNNDNISELSYQIISNLVKYMGANQGALFVLSEPANQEEEPKIILEAAYAFERRKHLKKEIMIGEGLVGQSVQEGDKIFLTQVPEDYVEIKSGLGETLPRCVLIVPLKINEEIRGVVEIASIHTIENYKIDFVEKLGENIASTISSAKTNERTKKLLSESQEMTEQMRSQEEEMRQNMEEMEATQEEMGRAQMEMGEKEANLNALINNTTDSIILIDTNYEIKLMNDVIKNRYKGTQYEAMKEGTNALEMLGEVKEEWKNYYDKAFKGEILSFTIRSSVQGEDTFRHYDIHPIKQQDGRISGASIFSRDITMEKRIEIEKEKAAEKLAERGYVLNGMINNTDDTYFAINRDYEILVVNDVLKDRFKGSGIDLKPGDNILEVLPEDQKQKWVARYNQALDGENLRIEEQREVTDRTLTIETRCEPIFDSDDHVIGVTTISRDITDLRAAETELEKTKKELEILKAKK